MLYSDEQKIDSPNNKVGMSNWSPSDDEEYDSDDEEYDIKYDWSIDSIEKNHEKIPIETYGETSDEEDDTDSQITSSSEEEI